MTGADIAEAKARADDVVNGFARVRTQHAIDAARLARQLQAANLDLDKLRNAKPTQEDFGTIFSTLMKGKK